MRVADPKQTSREHAVYIISVAAELAGMHPQTLRIYERKGLVHPQRTSGNSRRYSAADIERLQAIQELTDEGINLAGAKRILELTAQIEQLRRQVLELDKKLQHRRAIAMPGRREDAQIVPIGAWTRLPWERGVR
jgi:MerR family transcriptional regulator/heat shock protein HspR